MTDEPILEDADELEEVETIDPEEGLETAKGLRGELEKANAKIRRLEAESQRKFDELNDELMTKAFKDLGLDPEVGIGKAAAITYEGDPDGLAAHVATEFGYYGAPHPMAADIADGYRQLDQVSSTAGSVPSETPWAEELEKAESMGDYDRALAMKSQTVAGWFRP